MGLLRPTGRSVTEVDHCTVCHLVWFDTLEFGSLDRMAWVVLLLGLGQPRADGGGPLPHMQWHCPRCQALLGAGEGQTAHGRHGLHACPAGHGHAQRTGALLASRGLFRPLLLAERVALGDRVRDCLHCGAPLDAHHDKCRYCGGPVLVVDLPRLAAALGADDTHPRAPATAHDDAPALRQWPCPGCGQTLDPTLQPHCPSCTRPVGTPLLAELMPWLRTVREQLARAKARADERALSQLHPVDRRRVASATQRDEHLTAVSALDGEFWRRWRLVIVALAVVLLLAWCNTL